MFDITSIPPVRKVCNFIQYKHRKSSFTMHIVTQPVEVTNEHLLFLGLYVYLRHTSYKPNSVHMHTFTLLQAKICVFYMIIRH